MGNKYKFHNRNGTYFVTFAVVRWVDVFTRIIYQEMITDSLKYCQREKGFTVACLCDGDQSSAPDYFEERSVSPWKISYVISKSLHLPWSSMANYIGEEGLIDVETFL